MLERAKEGLQIRDLLRLKINRRLCLFLNHEDEKNETPSIRLSTNCTCPDKGDFVGLFDSGDIRTILQLGKSFHTETQTRT